MKSEEILTALGDVDERYIEEAKPKKAENIRGKTLKWGTLTASLLLICAIAIHILFPPSFETFLKRYDKGYYREIKSWGCSYTTLALTLCLVPIDDHLAQYEEKPNARQSLLENYIGDVFDENEKEIFYSIKDKDTLEYLISENKDNGKLSLWRFQSFTRGVREQDGTLENWLEERFGHLNLDLALETCTFDEIFRIYGLKSMDEIEKIVIKPNDARDSDTKELIWNDFEEKTLTDRVSIQTVYEMLCKTAAYGNSNESIRFSYSFSKENGGRGFPCGICELSIVLKDGSVIDLIRYDAAVGAFQHGVIYSQLLSEEDVFTLNALLGIR